MRMGGWWRLWYTGDEASFDVCPCTHAHVHTHAFASTSCGILPPPAPIPFTGPRLSAPHASSHWAETIGISASRFAFM